MYTIDIVCVGTLKESYLRDACGEYTKRLSAYSRVSVTELKEARTPEEEGAEILSVLGGPVAGRAVIALDIKGKKFSSEAFSGIIETLGVGGQSHIVFIIGGSEGLPLEVLSRADMRLSFSDMTFPHQLMRVILLEQIYRSFRIMRGEPYHK